MFRMPLYIALLAVPALLGFAVELQAQSINWSDPQSPILKAVVLHQRVASEREVGNILVLRGGRPFAGVTRMTLVAGDSLVTGDQTAIVGYADQSWEAVVHPNTQVDFRGGEIKVAFGRMFARLKPTEQNLLPIAVSSNYGTITSGEGSFEIDVSEERAVITVISGTIDVTRPSREVVTLQALDEAVLIAEAPVATRPISTQHFTEIGERITALSNLGVLASPEVAQTTNPAQPPPADEANAETQIARNRTAQALLNQLGYDAGPPDGVAGPRTLRAVASFRLDRQLPGTTEIDEALITALRDTPAPAAAVRKAPTQAVTKKDPPASTDAAAVPVVAPNSDSGSTIPEVTGLDFEEARVKLVRNNQLIGRVTYQPDAKASPGTVLRQFPPPGDSASQRVSVDLVIARAQPAKAADNVMTAESVAAALGAPPPPPPPPAPATTTTGSTSAAAPDGKDSLGAKGYLGTQDDVAGLFRPEQKLSPADTGGSNVLSQEELSACLRIEDDYLAQKLRVTSLTQRQDATADEIAALDVRLDETLPKTDPNKPETLEAYNTLLDQRLRLFSEYKDKILPEARQNERQLKDIERSFQATCGGRPYHAEDLEAARKEASLSQ